MKRLICALGMAVLASACGSSSSTGPTAATVSFTGVFTGTYVVASCNDGGLGGFCGSAGFTAGKTFPLSLSLGQNGNSVSGNLLLGSISGNFQGTSSGSGLSGTAAMNSFAVTGLSVLTNVPSWNSTVNGNAMSGGFTVTFTIVGFSGNATVTANIVSANR